MMRKIYTEVELKWNDKTKQYERIGGKFYLYDGPVALAGGGGGSPQVVQMPPQTTTTVSKAEPWGPQQDYLKQGFAQAQNLFLNNIPAMYPGEMIAPQSNATNAAQQLTESRALNGSPVTAAGQNYLTDTLNGSGFNDPTIQGNYLYGGAGFNAALDAATRKAMASVNSNFGAAGRSHSGLADAAIAQNVGDSFAGLYSNERALQQQAIQNAQENQMRAATLAPSYAANDYNDINALAGVGQQQDQRAQDLLNEDITRFNYPQQTQRNQLMQYLQAIQGNYGGTSSGTNTSSGGSQLYVPQKGSNPIGDAFGGALSGLTTGMAGGFPLIGAGLGLLSGLFDF